MKFRTIKISSEGLGGNSAKFCTSENLQICREFIPAKHGSAFCRDLGKVQYVGQ